LLKTTLFLLLGMVLVAGTVEAQAEDIPSGLIYDATRSTLTFGEVAAYTAPVIWFSPDEPLLRHREDGYFQLPMPLPFEEPTDRAVVYFRITKVIGAPGAKESEFWATAARKEDWTLHLDKVSQITMHFFFYYPAEAGVGAHPHDYETNEFELSVEHEGGRQQIYVEKVIAHAHGVQWYFNTLAVREKHEDAVFPMTILVEEGKHGNCTDRNGDGYYSPGYDVNKRVNDAWGVKDIMGAGMVVTPNYNSWMTKVRSEESRIAPPLPEDSPWYGHFTDDYSHGKANERQYTLRPVPDIRGVDFSSIENGNTLEHFIEDKGYPDWPDANETDAFETLRREMFDEGFLSSYGYGYRYDGIDALTVTCPLFLTRNFEAPVIGGWFVNRLYMNLGLFKSDFKVWGHQITYTPSASRWLDLYVGAGYEVRDVGNDVNKTRFVYEAGNKFRANVMHSPLKFLRYLGSDFWGVRLGVRAAGYPGIDDLSFIVEVGAGVW
jgi:hypothetical protein